MNRFVCLILLVLLYGSSWAAEPAFRFTNAYWVDSPGLTDVQSVVSKEFTQVDSRALIRFGGHPLWVRVDITPNLSDVHLSRAHEQFRQPLVVRVSNQTIDRIEMFSNIGDQWARRVAGDRLPRPERRLCPDDTRCFLIEEPPPGGFTVYLKVSNRGVTFFNVSVLSLDELPSASAWRLAVTSVSMTIGLALLCVGLMILILEYRSRLLVAFCVFQLSVLFFMFVTSGPFVELLPGWHPDSIDLMMHLTLQFRVCATVLLFWATTAAFRPPPLFHRLCVVLMLMMAVSALMLLLGDAAKAVELASAVFALNPLLQIYGLIASRSAYSAQGIVLLISFAIVAMLGTIRFIVAYGVVDLELLQRLPLYFGDLRLNGLPIGIGFFTILLLERASLKKQREADLQRLKGEAAEAKVAIEKLHDRQGFIDMLAHEIQNPLATMRFAISSLQRVAGNAGDAGRHIHSLDVSARRIGEFIHHVNALSRIELMQPGATAEWVPAAQLIEEILSECLDPSRFVVQVEHGAGCLADRQMLVVIFENLIGNAQKYATPGSGISITVCRKGDRMSFVITNDVPPGQMPDRSRLFERFYRHPEVLGIPGSGLGLSVVRLAAQRLGASLEVQIEGNCLCFMGQIPK